MAKKLALFLDGTWNSVESRTNVWLLSNLVGAGSNAAPQEVYYDPGVGTAALEWIRGGALGYGLSGNVLDAYRWLVQHHAEGDEIYIFGFSRGAYTARSVAGLIAKCGLLARGARLSAETQYERYQLSETMRPIYEVEHSIRLGEPITDDERLLAEGARRVPIKFLGVWDTVGALGIPFGNIPGLSRRRYRFHHTRLSNLFEHACHALAIDEHRAAFEPTLWTRFTPKVADLPRDLPRVEPKVEQRWFAGAHADVGGGCSTTLSQIPLAWLAGKAVAAGLALRQPVAVAADAGQSAISDSYASFMFGLYRIAKLGRRFHRVIAAPTVTKAAGMVDTVGETIDASVFDRYRADPGYRPPGLVRWAEAKGIDPGALSGTVSAYDGGPVAS